MTEQKPDAMTEEATEGQTPGAMTKAEQDELNRILVQSTEQLNAEIWTANAREALNTPGQSVYLVSNESEVMIIRKYAKLAIDVTPKQIAVLLDLIIQEGAKADRLFIPKGKQYGSADSFKKRLETGLKEANIAIGVYVRPLPEDSAEMALADIERTKPGEFAAWIADNENVIDREREQYGAITGAGRLDGLFAYIKESEKRPIISTGYPTLDLELGDGFGIPGGLTAGLYTIGAISSLGKTTFAMQMADSIAAGGKDVLVIALEMAAFELMARSISRLTTETAQSPSDRKTVQGILQGTRWARYNATERQTIEEATAIYSELAKHLFLIEGIGNIGVEDVRKAIKRHIEMRGETPVLIVDYLQILAPADPHATDKANTDKAVLELKRISRDYNTPVICISSFNRDNYSERVSMKALKESGAIEYSSDVVIGLQLKGAGAKDSSGKLLPFDVDEAKRKDPREIEAVILKNRSGKTGETVQFEYDPKFSLFRDIKNGHKHGEDEIPAEFRKLKRHR